LEYCVLWALHFGGWASVDASEIASEKKMGGVV
jgi:hypothetical protein